MEVYTFLRIGKDREQVTLLPIGGEADGDENAVRAQVYEQLLSFRARSATCFLESDRSRLLAIIEGSFGTLERFDQAVAAVLAPLIDSKASRDIARKLSLARGRSGRLNTVVSGRQVL